MIAGYGGLSLNGLLDQDGYALTFGGTGTTVNGELTGAGGVVIQGTGVVFAGVNSYSGLTTISGQLSIRNNLALGAADGTNATGTTLSGGTLTLDGVLTVGGELLTVNAGSLTATGNSDWGGQVVVGGLLLRTAKDTTFTISGNISGSGGVTVDGGMTSGATTAGRYIFSGTNTYLGVTGFNNPNAGTLLVNGTQSSSSIYFGAGTGTLGGSGTVGDLLLSQTNHGCRVSPGAVPGPGILHSGSANLRYAQFVVEVNGDTAGNQLDNYDQLQVTGSVTLGSTLTVSIGNAFTPSIGQQFKIIDNDGSDLVSGTFKDLPEGSLLTLGRNVLRISYAGGDGNDIVLTSVPAAFWDGVPDGGGVSTNANWRTVTNWVGDREPSPGDNLIFPAGPSVVNTVNDFPAETVFGALVISGSGYTLSGKEITLQSGINASGSNNTLSLPITLSAPQMIAGYGGLSLNGLLDQDGHALTFGGTGTTVNGELTGGRWGCDPGNGRGVCRGQQLQRLDHDLGPTEYSQQPGPGSGGRHECQRDDAERRHAHA